MRPQDLPIVNAHLPDEGLDEGFDEEPQLQVPPPAPVVLFPPPVAEEPAGPPEPADYLEPMIPSRNPPLASNLEVPPPGAPGSTPNHPTDPSVDLILQGMTEAQLKLGSEAPTWVPDEEASQCMICAAKFTLVRRRHHCRACGKLLCSACCGEKAVLLHLDSKLGRVCKPCHSIMDRLDRHARLKSEGQIESSPGSSSPTQPRAPPNPNNPMDYCSTVPPLEQARSSSSRAGPSETPSVMVPVGVLKRNSTSGSANAANAANGSTHPTSPETNPRAVNGELKHVMFSDGIRPGGDLTEVDGSAGSPSLVSSGGLRRPPMSGKSRSKSSGKSSGRKSRSTADVGRSLLPEDSDQLPFIRHPGDPRPAFGDVNELAMAFLPSTPAVNPNHEEGAVASPSTLEQDPHTVQFVLNKNLIVHVKSVFYEPVGRTIWNFRSQGLASVGQDEVVFLLIRNEDECLPPRDIFDQIQSIYEAARGGNPVTNLGYTTILSGKPFLDSTDYGGFLYIKPTFQSRSGLDLPQHSPYLFGVLISKWEVSWARVFPLRLKLRLGAQAKYYPAPIWSDRDRTTAYRDVGNTIMKLLSDFRNFTYTLPVIKGMMIHSEEKLTTIIIPKDRYRQIQRALLNSNDPVLALGAIFSPKADSHLVAVHSDDTDKDGATRNLMSTSDYETRTINSLNGQRKVTGASFIVFNGALKSASGLRGKSSIVEDGIMVQVSQERMLEFRKSLERMEDVEIECGPVDPMNVATTLAKAVCVTLAPHLKYMLAERQSPLAVRVNLETENFGYEAGSNGQPFSQEFMNFLDDSLIPLLHGGDLVAGSGRPSLEMVFHILDC
ncbi:hypothetical protein TCAL_04497 [Tigriopus californicus]|uniref:FYVE-type domain-containing protein n=1 Tax=Tigriopus californicus TaxID=6832 RepID=A0A553PAX9_TIGCA|nr:hypothetical protein TCAL_04497 [Tigriopus californicus]